MSQTIGTVKVRVNTSPAVRVQSINYLPGTSIKDATDLSFEGTNTGRRVITYDESTQKFVVQDVPRLNGGTF